MSKACIIAAGLVLLSFASPAEAAQIAYGRLPSASTANLSSRFSLPKTNLDSFVSEANKMGEAEHIYGDEGVDAPPPYTGFNIKHRINKGIGGTNDIGLTTGHGSYLPDAWGSDEFLRSPGAQSLSGTNHGDHQYNGVDGSAMDADETWSDSQSGSSAGGAPGGANGSADPQQVQLPYAIGPDWIAVQCTHNGGIMGYMAPGESLEDFMSGRSGHILPEYAAEGQWILQNQLPLLGGG